MAFNGTEGEQIIISEAAGLTSNYRTANPNGTHAQYMGKDIINSILSQTGCVGIRSYYGINSSGKTTLVLVGVDENENDLVSGIVADRGHLCPAKCSNQNSINS